MKKIIPFKKDIKFKNHLYEVTSISLEHDLQINKQEVVGNLIVTGDYRITDTSTTTIDFNFEIPLNIAMDDKYDLSNVVIDINDFYYEIINSDTLSISIEVKIDKIEEILINDIMDEATIIEKKPCEIEEKNNMNYENKERNWLSVDEEVPIPLKEINQDEQMVSNVNDYATKEVKSIFSNIDDTSESYATYKVCIIRENDTVDSIITRYNTSKEELELYNDLKELKLGDKLIIPNAKN